jgi:hypothetical protein
MPLPRVAFDPLLYNLDQHLIASLGMHIIWRRVQQLNFQGLRELPKLM